MLYLQAKNEELAQRAVGVSQEELDATRAEFEARLGAAERKACTECFDTALHLAEPQAAFYLFSLLARVS